MISLAITTHNRPKLTVEAFEKVHDDDRIYEIVIVDDCSKEAIFKQLHELCRPYPKVKLFRNNKNVGMGANKKLAIEMCSNEWVIIFDSDNVIDTNYLDALDRDDNVTLNPNTIYCPAFAKPNFDYRHFSGRKIDTHYAKVIINQSQGEPLFNTCNYVVHRDTYLDVFEMDNGIKATDTIQFALKWLSAGKYFYVVKGMHYFHRVHDGSGFLADAQYNMKKAAEYKQKILAL